MTVLSIPSAASSSSEKKDVFFYTIQTPDGRENYFFLRAPGSVAGMLDQMGIERGECPNGVTILEAGEGSPDERTWFAMERLGYVRALVAA